ncbi:MAG TPA: hypothetical protein VJR58_25270 [Vineibacter sp.]|nr:hypothetical protein [Vineibacter sp.]
MKTIFAIASLALLLAACGQPQSANLNGATDAKLVAQAATAR